jgi:hypothetical protein
MDYRISFLEKNLENISSVLKVAEQKINFISGIIVAMFGFLIVLISKDTEWNLILKILTITCIILYAICLLLLAIASFPNTKGKKNSVLFFGSTFFDNLKLYKKEVNNLVEHDYLEDLISQCFINAKIAERKFKFIKISLILFYVGIVPWILSIFLLSL